MPHDSGYKQSDVEVVLSRGDFQNWDDAVNWLESKGRNDNEFTGKEVDEMIGDFRRASESGAEFSGNPAQVYEAATSH